MSTFTALDETVSLTAATAKTVVQVVPGANTPVRIVEIGVSFDSVTSTDSPVLVELVRQSTAGTSSALTLVADQEQNTKTATATARKTVTAEPTFVSTIRAWKITPVGGTFVMQFPLGREPDALTNRIGVRCTAPAGQTVTAYLSFEE